jgi:hypothetical protein
MPPPAGITFPTRRFVATEVNEATGVETIVIQSTPLPNNYTTDQAERPGIMQNARNFIAANPAVYRIYGPCSGAYYTDGDVIWDSRVSGPL